MADAGPADRVVGVMEWTKTMKPHAEWNSTGIADNARRAMESLEELRRIADDAERECPSHLWDYAEVLRDCANQIEMLTAPLNFAETDAAASAVPTAETGVGWLDDPLRLAKAVRHVIDARRARIYTIINANGGVRFSYMNDSSPRKRCDKIRAALDKTNKERHGM